MEPGKAGERVGGVLLLLGAAFWFVQTSYFGWNMRPMSHAEAVCDVISAAVIWSGLYMETRGILLNTRYHARRR